MTTRTWKVIESTPVYHHSTDGYVGQRNKTVAFCGTLQSAMNYIERVSANYGEYDEIGWYLRDLNGQTRWSFQFAIVNSNYSGPVANNWTDVPF